MRVLRLDCELAAVRHCVAYVDSQIQDHVFKLVGVGMGLPVIRLPETFDTHSLFDVTLDDATCTSTATASGPGRALSTLCVRNVLPAPFLRPRFASTRTTVLFSATLTPSNFYGDTLGLPDDTAWLDVPAPLHADQLTVHIAPQFNPVNEELRRRLDTAFGAGHDHMYLFPGIRKVVQAAGRVIRTLTDCGVVHLIGDRFSGPAVLRLLPTWWRIESPSK